SFPFSFGSNTAATYTYNLEGASLVASGFLNLGEAGESDVILEAAITDDGVIAILGEQGGVRRVVVNATNTAIESTAVFPDFDADRTLDASAIVFSPDGSTLYIATSTLLHSSSSDGKTSPDWNTELSDSRLCDMAISPDGLSVYVLGCGLDEVYHVRVDESGEYVSTANYSTKTADVGGSDAGDMFLMEVFEHSVVIGRETSDEIAVFQRSSWTGVLSSATTVNILDEAEVV
ncbi:unnamed protein product, partial [Ectocarpus sp. 12 AP-2014]